MEPWTCTACGLAHVLHPDAPARCFRCGAELVIDERYTRSRGTITVVADHETAAGAFQLARARLDEAKAALRSVPWWRPFSRRRAQAMCTRRRRELEAAEDLERALRS